MEKYYSNLSKKIIHILSSDYQYTEMEFLQMYYGIQIILYNIIITAIILISSYIEKCFSETLLLFTIFGLLRFIAGGYHFNSLAKCTCTTALIMLGGGKIISISSSCTPLCVILCIFANIIFFIHIPKGSPHNPYSSEYSSLQKKRLTMLSIFLNIMAIYSNRLRLLIAVSMAIVAVLLLPDIIHKSQSSE